MQWYQRNMSLGCKKGICKGGRKFGSRFIVYKETWDKNKLE